MPRTPRTPEQKERWARYMREYRKRNLEKVRDYNKEWMREYRHGPKSDEIRAHNRERRQRQRAEFEAMKQRLAALEAKQEGNKHE